MPDEHAITIQWRAVTGVVHRETREVGADHALLSLERVLRMENRMKDLVPFVQAHLVADETSAIGHQMLVRAAGVGPVALDVCLHHHEKTDGSGYPKGLKGEQYTRAVHECLPADDGEGHVDQATIDQVFAGRAGVEASETLGANIGAANSALETLSPRVAEQERASQRIVAETSRAYDAVWIHVV